MGRPVRNLSFNATGNVLSGVGPHDHALVVYRENAAIKQPRAVKVGSVKPGASGAFSVSLTNMPVGTHVLRVVQDGNDLLSEPVTAVVTVAS